MSKITSQFDKFTRDSDFKQLMTALLFSDKDGKLLVAGIIKYRYKDLGDTITHSLHVSDNIDGDLSAFNYIDMELWRLLIDKYKIFEYIYDQNIHVYKAKLLI